MWLFVLIADILLRMLSLYLFSGSTVRSLLIRLPFILSLFLSLCGCLFNRYCPFVGGSLRFLAAYVLLGNYLKLGVKY